MRKAILVIAGFLFLCSSLAAQDDIVAKFVARSHSLQGVTLPYRLFIPDNYSQANKYPLVLTLHGDGEAGTDNLLQIKLRPIATVWADPVNQAKHPCFVVSPQRRTDQDWESDSITATVSSLLDSLAREFSLDLNRIYITGLSAGAFAAWRYLQRYPDRFAAAVPMSGGCRPFVASLIGNTPIWNFHGTEDELVAVSYSRELIEALKAVGRTVVYTHCHNVDCRGLPDSVIAMYVASHADLLYTEYQTGFHDIWSQAYHYPLLVPWLFDKYRQTTGAIMLTNLTTHRILRGVESVTWNAVDPGDSVEIWFSPDAGGSWRLVSRSEPNTGVFLWDTRNFGDCAFGSLKIFLKNRDGFIYGHDRSSPFTVDNGATGTPFAKLLNEEFTTGRVFSEDTLTLRILAGDSKSVSLTERLLYSSNDGLDFAQFASYATVTDTLVRMQQIDLSPLENSDNAVIRVEVSDGQQTSSDRSASFIKRSPRFAGPAPVHAAGAGSGTIAVHIADQAALTGNLYRVMLDDTSLNYKFYNVVDVTTGATAVTHATQLDGTTEGPLFDGIRLVVKDYPQAELDRINTRWEVGVPTLLTVQIAIPTVDIGGQTIKGYPYPADYRISFYDHVVDTSSDAIFGTGRIPITFNVWNLTENRKSEIVFFDSDNNMQISSLDEIYILEPDSLGVSRLTWDLLFATVPQAMSLPVPGDEFLLATLKPFHSGDTFEFRGAIAGVNEQQVPAAVTLMQNYPNPFNPFTTIRYELPVRTHVTLKIFDVLGRDVRTLVDADEQAGSYRILFDGSNLASGVYFYRLQTHLIEGGQAVALVQSKKLLLLK